MAERDRGGFGEPTREQRVKAWIAAWTDLLELEREAEVARVVDESTTLSDDELVARGVLVRKLVVTDEDTGYGGRPRVDLARGEGDLPPHRFSSGDVVALRAQKDDPPIQGVVLQTNTDSIRVLLDDDEAEIPSGKLRLERLAPDVTFRRMREAVERVERVYESLRDALLNDVFVTGAKGSLGGLGTASVPTSGDGEAAAEDGTTGDTGSAHDGVPTLDASQRAAIAFALDPSRAFALIHGPPGTGKTTTLVELIRRAVARGEKVLAVAPSNVAVDNLAERLGALGLPIVRIGHPARFSSDAAREWSLDAQVEASGDRKLQREARREIDQLRRLVARSSLSKAERHEARSELKRVRGELRDLERAALRGVLERARVVLATTTGAADTRLADLGGKTEGGAADGRGRGAPALPAFDLVVIDEAGQALEPACWIALRHGRRAILAGDHKQLPPTILSDRAAKAGLARTLFERLQEQAGDAACAMLTVQYRMHETIMGWASSASYDGRLTADARVAAHLLTDLVTEGGDPVTDDDTGLVAEPLVFIDTAGCGFDESAADDEGSKSNPSEAALVATHVRRLLTAGVRPTDIGVITPYLAQVRLLRELLANERTAGVEIHTVDGFQGREKEAIVLSLVRSNDRGSVGFLADPRRLNVAVTRARRHCALIGDSATLSNDPFLDALLAWCGEHGSHRSAWEFVE